MAGRMGQHGGIITCWYCAGFRVCTGWGPQSCVLVCAWYVIPVSCCSELWFCLAGLACPPGVKLTHSWPPAGLITLWPRVQRQLVLEGSEPAPSPALSAFLTGHSGTQGYLPCSSVSAGVLGTSSILTTSKHSNFPGCSQHPLKESLPKNPNRMLDKQLFTWHYSASLRRLPAGILK